MALTGEVRHGLQLLRPELRDLDGLVLPGLPFSCHALLVGEGHQLAEILGLQGVEDVEEVLSSRAFPSGYSLSK